MYNNVLYVVMCGWIKSTITYHISDKIQTRKKKLVKTQSHEYDKLLTMYVTSVYRLLPGDECPIELMIIIIIIATYLNGCDMIILWQHTT